MAKQVIKADKVRAMLRRDLGKKTEEQLIVAVMKLCSFQRGLAKSYVRHYTPKSLEEQNAKTKIVKRGTRKKAVSERKRSAKKK